MRNNKNTKVIGIAFAILGGFLIVFVAIGMIFTFWLKRSTVTPEAKSLVENLGTKSEVDVVAELATLEQTETKSETQELAKVPSDGQTDVAAGQSEDQSAEASQVQVVDQNNEGQTNVADASDQTAGQAASDQAASQENTLESLIAEWNRQLDEDTVTNLSEEEQIAVRSLFANTIFFGDSMTQAIGEYGFLDMTNIVYQRSATIDVLIGKVAEVAATFPKQVIIFTGLNDCNHYTEIADYRRDYVTMLEQLKASIPGVQIVVSSLLPPSDALGQVRADLVRAPLFDQELRSICAENGVTYVDSTWIVRQGNYLDDGIHMNRTFYRVWFRYLMALLG